MAHQIAARLPVAPRKLVIGVTLVAFAVLGLSVAETGQPAQASTGASYYTLQVPGSGTLTFTEPVGRITTAHELDGKIVAAEAVLSGSGLKGLDIVQGSANKNIFLFERTGAPDGPVAGEWELWNAVPEVTTSGTSAAPIVTVTFLANQIAEVY